MFSLRRLTRPLLAAAAVTLVLAAQASAGHQPGFGHPNPLVAGERTTTTCDVALLVCLVVGTMNANADFAIWGDHTGTNTTGGVLGTTTSPDAKGVEGRHLSGVGTAPGVLGLTNSASANAVGVEGRVEPTAPGSLSAGVRGINNGTGGSGVGVWGSQNGSGYGVYGATPNGIGVRGFHTGAGLTGVDPGVWGATNSSTVGASGVNGEVYGNVAGTSGVFGESFSTGAFGIGVRGAHYGGGNGVYGSVQNSVVNAAGVLGEVLGTGGGGVGVYGRHAGAGYGVYGFASGSGGAGVVGQAPAGLGFAGFFTGNVHVTGTLSKGGGAFKIDHPLDPANKYLQHSFVESPDMKNVYDGVVRTSARGFATVKLPRYFSVLNRNFRYQLTSLSGLMDVAVVKEIANNRFTIQSEKPFAKVSWQVTGIRKDRWANANRIQVEQSKPASERGRYLNPELYGSKAKGILRTPAAPRVPDAKAVPRMGRASQ